MCQKRNTLLRQVKQRKIGRPGARVQIYKQWSRKVLLGNKQERSKGKEINYGDFWGVGISGGSSEIYKGPAAGSGLTYFRNSREASVVAGGSFCERDRR